MSYNPTASLTKVVWTLSALADLEGIRRYIGNFNPRAAQEMAARLLDAASDLAVFPHRGRLAGMNLRETTVVYPYIIRYRIEGDCVVILRVRHGMRQS